LDDCIEEAQKLFSQADWSLDLNGRPYQIEIEELRVHQFNVRVWDKFFKYNIRNWLPLRQKDLKEYEEITRLKNKIAFLEKRLANHIIAFAKGIGCRWEGRIEVHINDIYRENGVYFKNNRFKGISLEFETNFFLPNFIGLGKGVSHGFGVVRTARPFKKTATEETTTSELENSSEN